MRLRVVAVLGAISLVLVESMISNAEQILSSSSSSSSSSCDLFQGRWELEDSSASSASHYYNYTSCPFIQKEFNCNNNGRSDHLYLNYYWQPHSCTLSRFDGEKMLKILKGKSIMFVGDSLSRNQWESLICMLHAAVPETNYTHTSSGEITTFTFTDYEVKVMLDRTVYLVDLVGEAQGRILKLDSIQGSKRWLSIDVLVFNTWHWWNRRGPSQPWDYIEVGGQLYKDMDRVLAFEKALNTWATWVDHNIDPSTTKIFFQGISPSHYNGSEWNEPQAKSCVGQREPVAGLMYPGGVPPALAVVKKVLSAMKKPVVLLDITNLSLMRKDGHPSIYGLPAMDCSHWCLPGVPDTWNQILYNLII